MRLMYIKPKLVLDNRINLLRGISMKTFLTAAILIFSFLIINAQEWRKVTSASYGSLSDVFFINENTGWMVGSKGVISKTTDGGNNWFSPLSEEKNIPNTLYSVDFFDENNGYFGGSKNLLLKTTDGGSTVDTVAFPSDDKAAIKGIHFIDANTGWVISSQAKTAKLYYTSDGGSNWTIQINEPGSDLSGMSFYSSTKAICVGGVKNGMAIYTTNDGTTWTKSPMPTLPISYSKLDLYGVDILSETEAVIVGYGSSSVGLQPSIILKSTDGGANWNFMQQTESNQVYTTLYDVTFKDATTGIAVGGNATTGYITYKTNDGGSTWQKSTFPFGFTPKSIFSIGNKIWLTGSSGGSAFSDDFGNTWKLTSKLPGSTLYSFQFVSDKVAYAGGYGGMIMKTEDGGITWSANYIPGNNLNPTIEDISFVNENVGFLARKNRLISKTVDGGNTWQTVLPDTSWNKTTLYGIDFTNENFGIAVGKYGTGTSALYITTDGGNSWDKQIGTFDDQLGDVFLLDNNNGVIVGRSKLIAYTTDGANTWTKATLNGLPDPSASVDFNQVKILSDGFGLACGDLLMKTEDGGKEWSYINIPDLSKEIQSCALVNKQTWYITGSRFVFKTTDGGASWNDISDTTYISKNANLNSIVIDANGYPWLAGATSQIYTLAPLTDIEDKKQEITNNFILEQNYPNPFNPTTTISYSISGRFASSSFARGLKGMFVTLKVYDILGRVVSTLVNKNQKPGNYRIIFDGSKLSSGIYFYQLSVGSSIQTKKMIFNK